MQAIARSGARRKLRFAISAIPLSVGSVGGSALAMELDHTDRIEQTAAEAGCAVRDGKKRSGQMVYQVTCEEKGTTVDREVACKFNACVFAERDSGENR